MEQWLGSLVDKKIQCWSCPIFDRVFQVISQAAAAVYQPLSRLVLILFVVLLAFYILHAVFDNLGLWDRFRNLTGDTKIKDPTYFDKYFKSVLINGLIVVSLLGVGLHLPRLISQVTFEPVASITTLYTENMLHTTSQAVDEKISYQPMPMSDDGFFRPQLRDKIIHLMKASITQFQGMMKLGIAVMDSAFSWSALRGIGALMQHILIFFMGLYLTYVFFKLFIKFCFYFIDTIVALAMFAFFLPLSLVFFVFQNAESAAWMKGLGSGLKNNLKNVINAIVTLGAVVITYAVAMVLIGKFFAGVGVSGTDMYNAIMNGDIYSIPLSKDNIGAITLVGCIVLAYIVQFLIDKIPDIAKSIMKVFDVEEKKDLGEQMANDVMSLTKSILNTAKDVGKKAIDTIKGKPPAAPATPTTPTTPVAPAAGGATPPAP